jgi:hypothetical protein
LVDLHERFTTYGLDGQQQMKFNIIDAPSFESIATLSGSIRKAILAKLYPKPLKSFEKTPYYYMLNKREGDTYFSVVVTNHRSTPPSLLTQKITKFSPQGDIDQKTFGPNFAVTYGYARKQDELLRSFAHVMISGKNVPSAFVEDVLLELNIISRES